jgi:asparagine synthase (glutamine-hydrolysing)
MGIVNVCGIHGISWREPELIEQMVKKAHHRGPDASGSYIDDHVSLGHNLLAITETVENSKQPMVFGNGRFVLVYNGEIYNYQELRAQLSKLHDFVTDSDTEVLGVGLSAYGAEYIRELDGMFAFAFYDREAGKITIARDFIGSKPLYYSLQDGRFAFSSEMSSLHLTAQSQAVDNLALHLFFRFGFVPGSRTMFNSIRKVQPGEILQFDLRSKSVKTACLKEHFTEELGDWISHDNLRQAIRNSTASALMGRRELALYLSGGLDSSMILHESSSFLSNVRTFTTRFTDTSNPSINEDADLAALLSKVYGTKHQEVTITPESYLENIDACYQALSEPRYNRGLSAYFQLAREVSAKGVVVTVSGEGGDELFGGYRKYWNQFRNFNSNGGRNATPLIDRVISAWKQNGALTLSDKRTISAWCNMAKIFDTKAIRNFVKLPFHDRQAEFYLNQVVSPHSGITDFVNQLMFLDTKGWLSEECLIRCDQFAMTFGMEGRFPLLNRRVRRFAYAIPSEAKTDGAEGKLFIRNAYKKVLPNFIVEKKKTGWASPIEEWLRLPKFRASLDNYLDPGFNEQTRDLFDYDWLRKTDSLKARFTVIGFQIWAKHNRLELS